MAAEQSLNIRLVIVPPLDQGLVVVVLSLDAGLVIKQVGQP